ncbi:SLATT domain-containing protein [Enterococcus hulanensis]|uniref:SLATT domain-containing protein n=1 Tax=Enterococcus hulanensis TaxID=2559929 RepID=UPI002891B97C|nr:SLATT domain-containing protein [Enterococcus hulanensis]MDT2660486.1 SLATT domain-containing protein [Enterococcus hulanensis]
MEDLKKFMDSKIWVTKKTRMESEKNLMKRNTILNYTLIYYSGCLAVMSYLTLATNGSFNLTVVAGVISVILPSVNIFQYKADYSRRAANYKECYLNLENLENECKALISKKKNGSIEPIDFSKMEQNIYNEYNKILAMCENHSDFDYYMFRKNQVENKNTNFSISNKEQNKYTFLKIIVNVGMFIVILIPMCFLFLKIFS